MSSMGLLHDQVNTLVAFTNVCRKIDTALFDMMYFFIKVEAGTRCEGVRRQRQSDCTRYDRANRTPSAGSTSTFGQASKL